MPGVTQLEFGQAFYARCEALVLLGAKKFKMEIVHRTREAQKLRKIQIRATMLNPPDFSSNWNIMWEKARLFLCLLKNFDNNTTSKTQAPCLIPTR